MCQDPRCVKYGVCCAPEPCSDTPMPDVELVGEEVSGYKTWIFQGWYRAFNGESLARRLQREGICV